jgi:hypothetical protein
MARGTQDGFLVVVPYDPSASSRARESHRSSALSYAARVAHERRKRKSPQKQSMTRKHGDALVRMGNKSPTPPGYLNNILVLDNPSPLHSDIGCIQHGNSDPFASLAVPATPEATYQMSEWKSHLLSNSLTATRPLTEGELKLDLSFDDELHARAVLFVCAAFLSLQCPLHDGQNARLLQTKASCLQQLHSAVSLHGDAPLSAAFLRVLSVVFLALVLSGAAEEARDYARKLQLLLLAGVVQTSAEEIAIFCRTHYYDFQASLIHFQPPVLDSRTTRQAWHEYLPPILQWWQRRLPAPSAVRAPSFSAGLESLFTRLQRHVDVQCEGLLTISRETSMSLLPSTTLEATSLLEELFAYRDVVQQLSITSHEPLDRFKWQTESIMVIAALAFLACAVYGPEVASLRKRAAKAMRALQHELEQIPIHMTHRIDFDVHDQARLWAYYIGALWESECDSTEMWFAPRLRQIIRERGITSWTRLKHIVDRFVSVPQSHTPGMVWFLGMVTEGGHPRSREATPDHQSLVDLIFAQQRTVG